VRIAYTFCVVIIGLLFFSARSYSLENKSTSTLNLGYSEFAPYTFTSAQGLPSGEVNDIVKTVVLKSGYDFTSVPGPNRRLFRDMLIDNIDLLMVVPFKDADSDKLIFGEKAFDTLEITIFWLPEKARPVTDIVQLREKRLITIAGYSYGGVFKGEGDLVNAELFLSESHPQALKALNLGRAPYLLAYKKAVQFYSEDDTEVSLRSFNFKSIPLVLSIRRSYPDAEKVLKELESRYAELYPERFKALNPVLPAS
jgi:polar amino acid transport system substrate-binding protein